MATPGAESAVYDCLVESCSQSPSCRRRVVSCLSLSRPGLAQQQNAAHIKLLLLLDDDATPRRDALRHVAGPCGAARQAGLSQGVARQHHATCAVRLRPAGRIVLFQPHVFLLHESVPKIYYIYVHKDDAQRINTKWRAWPQAKLAKAWLALFSKL